MTAVGFEPMQLTLSELECEAAASPAALRLIHAHWQQMMAVASAATSPRFDAVQQMVVSASASGLPRATWASPCMDSLAMHAIPCQPAHARE